MKYGTDLVIGPANHAGQAYEWACAVNRYTEYRAESLMVKRRPRRLGGPSFEFSTHRHLPWPRVTPSAERRRRAFAIADRTRVLAIDGFVSILHNGRAPLNLAEVESFASRGAEMLLIAHGSDIRDPVRHMERLTDSYFAEMDEGLRATLERVARSNRELARRASVPLLVSTPDLLLEHVDSHWLPTVVPLLEWEPLHIKAASKRPLIVHAPSSAIKGSSSIDPYLDDLDRRGMIRYLRLKGVAHSQLKAAVREADVVVDQIRSGFYGVAAIESLAAACVTVGNVAADVRGVVDDEIPIVDATPSSFPETIASLLDTRSEWDEQRERGLAYVQRWHDGRYSASVLAPLLQAYESFDNLRE